ncbi:unnamed protein product, partial [Sphenostylis stenocarpa]
MSPWFHEKIASVAENYARRNGNSLLGASSCKCGKIRRMVGLEHGEKIMSQESLIAF